MLEEHDFGILLIKITNRRVRLNVELMGFHYFFKFVLKVYVFNLYNLYQKIIEQSL